MVEGPDGRVLRKFVDTNGDNVVDQWSYYKDGLEVYRDIDSTFKGKADQYRWFNTGGTRWGVDKGETGKIDSWKMISAEEVTAEVVAALAKQDVQRFARLLLTPDELRSLGLGKAKTDALAAKIDKAEDEFKALLARQKAVTAETRWVQFGGTKPGIVPIDAADATGKELRVHENVIAIVETAGKHSQVQIGTLIQVGDVWRLIGARSSRPKARPNRRRPVSSSKLQTPVARVWRPMASGEQASKLMAELEKLEQFDPRRPDLIEQIAQLAKTPEERSLWYRQLADTIGAAVQSGKSPDGDKRLAALFEKLQKNEADHALAAYVRFRQLTAAIWPEPANAEGRFRQDSIGMAQNLGTVHRRLSHRARHGRSHVAIGHRTRVCWPGRRRQEVVWANRRRISRLAGSKEIGRGCHAARFRGQIDHSFRQGTRRRAQSIFRSFTARWC